MIKKVIGTVILISMLMSATVFPIGAVSREVDEENYYTGLMYDLGIYKEEYGLESGAELLTRGSAAYILAGFYTDINLSGTLDVVEYNDIAKESEYSVAVKIVSGLGMMNGYVDNSFRPYEYFTVEQAAKTVVELIGHRVYANIGGGFPTGYLAVAKRQGLLDGIEKGVEENITVEEFARMINNSFDADFLEQKEFGTGVTFSENRKILDVFFNINIGEGLAEANEFTGLIGKDKTEKNTIMIDGVIYNSSLDNIDLLGHNLKFYYKKDREMDRYDLIRAEKKNNKVIEVAAEDISGDTTALDLRYYKNNKKVSNTLTYKTSLILNGVRKLYYTEKDLMPKSGKVTLIDANKDNIYETVKTDAYINYWVDHVYEDSDIQYIFDKRDGIPPLKIDNSENSECSLNILDRNKDFQVFTPGCVLTVYVDSLDMDTMTVSGDITLCTMYISTKEKSVTIKKITDKYVTTTDSIDYKLSPFFDIDKSGLKPGQTVKLALNYYDEIIGTDNDRDFLYGFIVGAAKDKGLSEKYQIKIFTENDEFVIFETEKVAIDGKTYKEDSICTRLIETGTEYKYRTSLDMDNAKGVEQFVRIYLNEYGELKEIDTISENNSNSEAEKQNLRLKYDYDKNSGFSASVSIFKGTVSIREASVLRYAFGIDSSVLYFYIPKDARDTESYYIRKFSKNSASFTQTNSMSFFDADEMDCIPVMAEYGTTRSYDVSNNEIENCMIVNTVERKLAIEGDEVTSISGVRLCYGDQIEKILKSDDLLAGTEIKPGDIIAWNEDSNERIMAIKKIMGVPGSDRLPGADGVVITASNPDNWNSAKEGLMFAYPIKNNELYLKLTCDYDNYLSSGESDLQYLADLKHIYTYNSAAREYPVSKSNLSELKTIDEFGLSDGDRVLVLFYEHRIRSIIIYR